METESAKNSVYGKLRVVDLTRVLAGPWAMQIFGDLGAEIIKIERPNQGDECRLWGPPWVKNVDGTDSRDSSYFLSANRNKQSIAVDFSKAEGQKIILDLVRESDIFIENYKVGALKKYGLDYESIRAVKPDIIYCSVTGFGQDGPCAERPGYDYLFQGLSGMMSITGERDDLPGGGPQRIPMPLIDMFTGMFGAIGIQAALYHRKETGKGQHIDVSLFDSAIALCSNPLQYSLGNGRPQKRTGNAAPSISPYGVYPASDGKFIIASANQSQWVSLCKAVGRPELAEDPRFVTNGDRITNQRELTEILNEIFMQHDRAYWDDVLYEANVPAGPINDLFQALEHPQAKHRESIMFLEHGVGTRTPSIRSPLRLSETPVTYRAGPPVTGQHTLEVLTKVTGLSEEKLIELESLGVIQQFKRK